MSRRRVIAALGLTQILAWGSSYYLPAVLAKPIATDTGWPLAWVVGGLSIGLLVAGAVSASTGSLIQRRGGRPVLVGGALFLAVGQTIMGLAPNLPTYVLAWAVAGVGMSASLYDAGFGTLGRLYGKDARSAIAALTLFGGFASTVCWPLSALLVETFGWRAACFAYAGIQIAVSVPAILLSVPKTTPPPAEAGNPTQPGPRPEIDWPTFSLLASIAALAAMIASMLSVHMLTVLQLRGMDLAGAVALGTLVGPAQVGGRLAEMLLGRRHHPRWAMLASVLLLAAGVGLLLSGLPLTAVALVLYGAGNGIHTIARGALPLVLFSPDHYSWIMGRLATPSLVMQAAAPSIGALLLTFGGVRLLLATLFAAALLGVVLTLCLNRSVRKRF